jgi:hypothetical protein
MKKVTSIEIVYDDGSKEVAYGDHAAEVLEYINGAQIMCAVNGLEYSGRRLTIVEPEVERA